LIWEVVDVLCKEERRDHAKTRAQLTEAQDKLELALGKVDILRKQIQREKAQFEQTLVVRRHCCFSVAVLLELFGLLTSWENLWLLSLADVL